MARGSIIVARRTATLLMSATLFLAVACEAEVTTGDEAEEQMEEMREDREADS